MHQGCIVPNFVEFDPVVLEKKFFLYFVNVYSIFANYLPLEKGRTDGQTDRQTTGKVIRKPQLSLPLKWVKKLDNFRETEILPYSRNCCSLQTGWRCGVCLAYFQDPPSMRMWHCILTSHTLHYTYVSRIYVRLHLYLPNSWI